MVISKIALSFCGDFIGQVSLGLEEMAAKRNLEIGPCAEVEVPNNPPAAFLYSLLALFCGRSFWFED